MRRCLPALLSGLVIVSPLAGPAQACWPPRRADPCGPVILVTACPPVHLDACCEPTGELVVTEAMVIEEVACPPVSVCCGEEVVVEHEHEPLTTDPVVELESVAAPRVLAPAGEEESVLRASNEEPTAAREPDLADQPAPEPAAEPLEPDDGTPAGEPVPVAPEPAMPEPAMPEPTMPEPTMPEPTMPEPTMPELALPEPIEPEPIEPEPPQPAPLEDDNFFEDLDAEDEAAGADEAALLDQTAEPTAAAAEPLMPDPFSAGEEPAVEPLDEPAPEPADQPLPDPFAEPMDDDSAEPDPEPAAAEDDPVSVEPSRRWIDATGTVSLVARLIEVAPDGRCLVDSGGRRLLIPIAKLSPFDRDYVQAASGRLAGVGDARVVDARVVGGSEPSLATAGR